MLNKKTFAQCKTLLERTLAATGVL